MNIPQIRYHLKDYFKLGIPIVISRLLAFGLVIVDNIMLTSYSTAELRSLTAAIGPIDMLFGASIGLSIGIPILTARAFGTSDKQELNKLFFRGIFWCCLAGSILVLVAFLLAPTFILHTANFYDDYVESNMQTHAVSLFFAMILIGSIGFIEGMKKTMISMYLMIIANILNLLFNWLWIYGNWGFDPYGALGSSFATLTGRFIVVVLALLFIFKKLKIDFNFKAANIFKFKEWKELRILGYATFITIFVESFTFGMLSLWAVRLGEIENAATVFLIKYIAISFMVALGFAAVSNIKISIARATKNIEEIKLVFTLGILLVLFSTVFTFSILYYFSPSIIALITEVKEVQVLFLAVLPVVFIASIPDCLQMAFCQGLRALNVVWRSSIIASFGYLFLMLPVAYYLAFIKNYGTSGLFQGIIFGATVLTFLYFLLTRFIFKRLKF